MPDGCPERRSAHLLQDLIDSSDPFVTHRSRD
jgi:hypothetical protein